VIDTAILVGLIIYDLQVALPMANLLR